MKLERPIFISAFARGGSRLLLDLFLSHPRVCGTPGELQMVFTPGAWTGRRRPWVRPRRMLHAAMLRRLTGMDLFEPALVERPSLPPAAERLIDRALYASRFVIRQYDGQRRYPRAELARCRLATKGIGGLVFMMEPLRQMYPDGSFFLLVRNGLAITEGRIRRGRDPEVIAHEYEIVSAEMLRLTDAHPNCHLVRYEDMVSEPRRTLERVYELAGLPTSEVERVRFRAKQVLTGTGEHVRSGRGDGGFASYGLDEISEHFVSDLDRVQISSMDEEAKRRFLQVAGEAMTALGYPAP